MAEEALRDEPANEANFRAAADIELEEAEPLRENAFKVALARNIITRTLLELSEER
jgi:xanthine dehydrogenase YagS FAD-binding subunit